MAHVRWIKYIFVQTYIFLFSMDPSQKYFEVRKLIVNAITSSDLKIFVIFSKKKSSVKIFSRTIVRTLDFEDFQKFHNTSFEFFFVAVVLNRVLKTPYFQHVYDYMINIEKMQNKCFAENPKKPLQHSKLKILPILST